MTEEAALKRDLVVVGASAGGVEALTELVSLLPGDFDAAVLVVLHIPPHSPSLLHQVIGRRSKLPVVPAVDGEAILPRRVYVASPDQHLMCSGNFIRLTRGPRENRVRPSIDVLFRSAAYNYGPRAIGVVLSGLLDDGTAGLWAIKDHGGIAMVQSPQEAMFASMPESALKQVQVDHVLSVTEIPKVLSGLVKESPKNMDVKPAAEWLEIEHNIALGDEPIKGGIMKLGPISPNTCPECHGILVKIEQGEIRRFRCHTGHSFSMETLLVEIEEQIDKALWNAVRSMEEHIFLLQEMLKNPATANGDPARIAIQQIQKNAEEQAQKLREMLFARTNSGQDLEAAEK